ncbi:MAG: preprotein translocase subunit SecG [Anaerolineales bacterium]|nr:preprotein translocase subunit SecG [Anaerolineales bacterium]MCX7609883.1 preprotein translocase subunit SecG [Anaerolineales bacterium]MDW8227518.1 preprotein translocase subunit SecG [Anaerolineales bacterium]
MKTILDISLILTSIALIFTIVLQSKGAGLGGLTGSDSGGIFTARRGIERTLFRLTIIFSVVFFGLAIASIVLTAR